MLCQILQHFQANTPLGTLMFIHLAWTQMIAGSQRGILTDTGWKINCILNTWWLKVQRFLNYIQARLDIQKDYTVPPLQQDDISIMDAIIDIRKWTPKQLRWINAVRMYLQVTYLSKLTTKGKYIEQNIINNQQPWKWSHSKLFWPKQPKPGKTAWKLWRLSLAKLCHLDGRTLITPLTNIWNPTEMHNRQ